MLISAFFLFIAERENTLIINVIISFLHLVNFRKILNKRNVFATVLVSIVVVRAKVEGDFFKVNQSIITRL